MASLKSAMDSAFWDLNVSSPHTLEGSAKVIPGDPFPLDGARASRALRIQQLSLLGNGFPLGIIPSYSPASHKDLGSFSLQSLLLRPSTSNWWLGLIGQIRPKKLISSIKAEFFTNDEFEVPTFKDAARHFLDKSLYSVGLCTQFLLTPASSVKLSTEGDGEKKGRRSKVMLFHKLPYHDITLEAAWPELFIDHKGQYWDVPESISLDLSSLVSEQGLRYRVGVHKNSGHPQAVNAVNDEAPTSLRMAKAEELAQMVVLPDSELDMRRLVKKTHKGEVEVEQFDNTPTEVQISHDQDRPRSKEPEVSTPLKSVRPRNEGKTRRQNSSVEESFTFPSSDGSDLLQGLMVDDELKDLPPIVSLDEFMESLDNEPPFEIPPEKGTPASQKEDSENDSHLKAASEKEDSETGSHVKASGLSPKESVHSSPPKGDEIDGTDSKPKAVIKSEDSLVVTKSEDKPSVIKSEDNSAVRKTSDSPAVKSGDSSADLNSRDCLEKTESIPVQKPKGEHMWGGALQLSISTKASVIGIFKSGEKGSVKDWPRSLEIKGRVRLDAFEKFLQELPQSRSRAVMVVHFVPKEGSSETENASLREVQESYISDERVGFSEPCSGVELYFCPPHNKTCEMLSKIIQEEHVEELNTIDNGLIGVIVWRKQTSPKSSSHQKHASKKQHYSSSSSRRHHDTNSNANYNSRPSQPRVLPPTHTKVTHDDEEDEVPPGFGPPASRDDDDLPEFNYSGASNPPAPQFSTQRPSRGPGMYPESQTSRPVDKMRELILKYGQNDSRASWISNDDDDDDDDIPEWQPTAPPTQYQRPQLQAVSSYQQPILRPRIGSPLQQQQPLHSLQPQVHASGLPPSNPYWQQGNQWAPPPPQSGGVWPTNAAQPESGQFYGEPDRGTAGQPGIAWRQNAPRSRGF